MNDNVTYLQPNEVPHLQHITDASRAFTAAWQQGMLKFAPLVHEGIERRMKLFDGCRQQLAHNAQRLVAELNCDPLADILDALGEEDDAEFFSLAEDTRRDVLSHLGRLLAHLTAERQALGALPALNGDADQSRLLKQQKISVAAHQQLVDEHSRETAKAEAVVAAIATLEANGLQTRFGGVVPSLADLQKMAVPGGEAMVTAETISKAVESLKELLGDLIEGMRYAQLQRERRAVQERVNGLARQVREQVRAQNELLGNLAALDELPGLREHCAQWDAAVSVLSHSLQARQAQASRQALVTSGAIAALAETLAALLAFLRNLLEQDRRAL